MTNSVNAVKLLSEAKFYESYSRWDVDKGRYETWDEAVERVMNMHRTYYAARMSPELEELIDGAERFYKEKKILGAQRALQFGGDQLLKTHMKLYNCTSTYADRPAFFNELLWVLLCGAGAGFSVQKHHVAKLPEIQERKKQAKAFVAEDSIEGWADCLGVLMSSYFVGGGEFPEFEGRKVYFDLSNIRPKGALISGGFKAPGPEPLRRALDKIEHLIQGRVLRGEKRLRPIDVYDIAMHAADAVLSGGVRRSATIALFSPDDEEMTNAKTGNWFIDNPQRARSNNSVILVRDQISREDFAAIMKRTKEYGEPGFIFSDSTEFTFNPCVEVGMLPITAAGISGWQGCNLCEINGAACLTAQDLWDACYYASVLGTLQAGYTQFNYLTDATKEIFDREALLGVSITGWMNNPDVLFNEENVREGARIVKRVNKTVAKLIGINPSARSTVSKPSGNASVLLMTASGITGEHAPRYIRNAQMNKEGEVVQLIKDTNPYMVEESVWSEGKTDYVVSFPVIAPKSSIFKKDLLGVSLLEKVKFAQNTWIEEGTDEDLCTDKRLRHNISNTVQVRHDQWDEVENFLYTNRRAFAGVSFISDSGDKDYAQAPFTEVLTEEEILERYGSGALFGAGLVVEAQKLFGSLWRAVQVASNPSSACQEELDGQVDWIRKFNKFSDNYFDGNRKKSEYCLKDLALLHKWIKIQQNFRSVDFSLELEQKKYTEVDSIGAAGCYAGGCEIVF